MNWQKLTPNNEPKENSEVLIFYLNDEGERRVELVKWLDWLYAKTKAYAGHPIDFWAYPEFNREMQPKYTLAV